MALDRAFRHIARKDLKDLIKNGTQTLNIIKDSYADTRFSPVFQEKIVLSGKGILKFLKGKQKQTELKVDIASANFFPF